MRLIRERFNRIGAPSKPSVVTIGNFDGVHLGHQAILKQVTRGARERNGVARLMLFEPQPREFFQAVQGGQACPPRLMNWREKFQTLSRFELEAVVLMRFDARLSRMPADAFVRSFLVEKLNVQHLVVGSDFRFGADRVGDLELLGRLGRSFGFSVEPADTLCVDDVRVSSTRIRALLEGGEVEAANGLLGRAYGLSGRVVRGNGLGRTWGVPTANVALALTPPPLAGVFAVQVIDEHQRRWPAVANLGLRPTLEVLRGVGGSQNALSWQLEVHLLDYEGDLYAQRLRVEFHHALRRERRFADQATLVQAIRADVLAAKAYWRAQNIS